MRRNGRQNSILNSPIVRSFVKPVIRAVGAKTTTTPRSEEGITQASLKNEETTTPTSTTISALKIPVAKTTTPSNSKKAPISIYNLGSNSNEEDVEIFAEPYLIPTQPEIVEPSRKRKRRSSEANSIIEKEEEEIGESTEDGDGDKNPWKDYFSSPEYQLQLAQFTKIRTHLDSLDDGSNYNESTIPASHKKYWAQRNRLFSAFQLEDSPHPRLDLDGWFSVTPERIARQIAVRCCVSASPEQLQTGKEKPKGKQWTVLDAFCGVGGNAIQFALCGAQVIALDTSVTRLLCAKHNAYLYHVADRIRFIHVSFQEFTTAYEKNTPIGQTQDGLFDTWDGQKIDVVFLSPPWGGIEYNATDEYPLVPPETSPMNPPAQLILQLSKEITYNIALFLPRNVDLTHLSWLSQSLGLVDDEYKLELEEEWMYGKLKAVTAYYGDLLQ